jgi:hypothetical protein
MARAEKVEARPPRPPGTTRALELGRATRRSHYEARERLERRSVLRGLILLAVLALLAGIARAGLRRVFVHGWWNQW